MSFKEQIQAENAEKEALAANTEKATPKTAAPVEDADREMPSVNTRKKSGGAMQKIGLGFVVLCGLYLMYQVNSGPSSKEKAVAKKEAAEAKANGVTAALPAIQTPDVPPAIDGVPVAHGTASGVAVASGPDGAPVPAIAVADGKTPPTGPNGKKELSPWEQMRLRRQLGDLRAKYDGGSGQADQSLTKEQDIDARYQRATAAAGQSGAPVPGMGGMRMGAGDGGGNAGGGELNQALQPTITKGVAAAKLFNRTYLIPKGAFLDCTLETRIDSTVPGMTSCILTRNIYSDNNRLILLDRGSKITGQYQGGIKQGQARIFVLWTRVQTPTGVIVNLDSPGTDALGASGHDGYVDSHFAERFGAAIMLSLIGDIGDNVARQSQGSNGTQITFGNTQKAGSDMATEALKSTINIPPTLMKNHGEHINIYVARDLDFRPVYGIRTSN